MVHYKEGGILNDFPPEVVDDIFSTMNSSKKIEIMKKRYRGGAYTRDEASNVVVSDVITDLVKKYPDVPRMDIIQIIRELITAEY